MNFKGTKGPWGYDIDENNHGTDLNLPNDTVISHARDSRFSGRYVIEREEVSANMRLISKAPEMLEMLEKCLELCEALNPKSRISNEVRRLIKEATTI